MANRKVGPRALSKIKAIHTIIINNIAPLGNANYVREESENGGEQEAAIPLTGGFVRSVMVRVQLLFTHFCRRGRHVFASSGNLQTSEKIAGSFESGFSLNRRPLIRRKVQRAKPTTCCFPHNVAADERGSHSKRCSRAPFITNAPRRMEKRRAPPLKIGLNTRLQFADLL